MRIPKPLKPWHSLRIRENDVVLVINGDEAGKRARVVKILPRKDRLIVEGVNMVVKHRRAMRGRTATQLQQGRIEMPASIHRSKVMLICPRCDKSVRVRMAREGDHRVRVCKACGETIDVS